MNANIKHMTHIQNLPAILQHGGLWCDRQAGERRLTQQGIGHHRLKASRAKWPVKVGLGGFLCDYVPFYFASRTPMLSAIHHNKVEGLSGGQDGVVYLITSTRVIQQAGLPFFFTDGHAAIEITRQFTNLTYLHEVDWTIVREKYWSNTDDDPDRKRRKQAEFLVHDFLPWTLIQGIAVKTQAMAEQVAAAVAGQSHVPPVQIKSDWYY